MTGIADKSVSMRELALHLRRERENSGLTQTQVAAIGGVTQCVYAGIELGNKPLTVHRAGEYGDSVILGAVRYLLSQLKSARYELVQAGDERVCAESYSSLAALVEKSSQVCQVMAAALADGVVSDDELDQLEDKAAEAEETFRRLRRDIAIKRGMREQIRKESAIGLRKVRTGEVFRAKAAAK